jgi:hypothetical protein
MTVVNHSLDWLPVLLPSTVVAAIILFGLKEILEWNRRRRANKRQIAAFKTLLARECELNRWALERLDCALVEMSGQSQVELESDYEIERRRTGKIIFRNDDGSSWPLPETHLDFMRDNMFDVAALDGTLFPLLKAAYDSVIDLEHVRDSLISYLEDGDQHLEAFIDYGRHVLNDVKSNLEKLYFECTGSQLDKGRVR